MIQNSLRVVLMSLGGLILAVTGVFAFRMWILPTQPHTVVGCTMEALVCPDGSSVGRQGPSCKFTPCPSFGVLTGQYLAGSQGPRLAVESPEGVGNGVSYAVPLDLSAFPLNEQFIGTTISLRGMFVEGNTFRPTGRIEVTNDDGTPVIASTTNELQLRVGKPGFVSGLRVTVENLIADSRCPKEVQCIQAGSVSARVTLQSDTDQETREFVAGSEPHAFDTYRVALVDVSPYPSITARIHPSAYVFTFRVSPLDAVTPPLAPKSSETAECFVGGCSGEVCSDQKDVVSACVYRSEFACYKEATCTRQSSGKCGWTHTPALERCLSDAASGLMIQ